MWMMRVGDIQTRKNNIVIAVYCIIIVAEWSNLIYNLYHVYLLTYIDVPILCSPLPFFDVQTIEMLKY